MPFSDAARRRTRQSPQSPYVLVTPNDVQLSWSNPAAANNLYRLMRNGTVLSDSLVVPRNDTSWTYKDSDGAAPVTPGTQYTYKLYRTLTNDSASLIVKTQDTSKDNYTWNVMNVGTHGELYGLWSAGNPNSVWLCGGESIDSSGSKFRLGSCSLLEWAIHLLQS